MVNQADILKFIDFINLQYFIKNATQCKYTTGQPFSVDIFDNGCANKQDQPNPELKPDPNPNPKHSHKKQ